MVFSAEKKQTSKSSRIGLIKNKFSKVQNT